MEKPNKNNKTDKIMEILKGKCYIEAKRILQQCLKRIESESVID